MCVQELDAGVHEEAAMDVPRAAEGEEDAESYASEASGEAQAGVSVCC